MTKASAPHNFHQGLAERLAGIGMTEPASSALLDLDTALFLWHRMAAKGEVPGRIIAELGLDLELTQFSALTAILRVENGVGRDRPQPPTIGLMAEEMAIDPSRASRIASELIQRGYLRRESVQEDGRKSVLVLTDKAVSAFAAFRERKWDRMIEVFGAWPEADLITFSTLFSRYSDGMRRAYGASGPSQT